MYISYSSEREPLLPVAYGASGESSLYVDAQVEVKRMGYVDIPRAVENTHAAIRVDSITRYLDDADHSPLRDPRDKLAMALTFLDAVYRHKALTVEHGEAILTYVPGSKKPLPIFPLLTPFLRLLEPAERTKRIKEVVAALTPLLDSLGDRIKDMLEIQGLATAPAKQGRGYGTALVQTVNDMADKMSRATYVITDDAYGFYALFGYKLVGEAWVGGDNPEWKQPPVPMVREPQQTCGPNEKASL